MYRILRPSVLTPCRAARWLDLDHPPAPRPVVTSSVTPVARATAGDAALKQLLSLHQVNPDESIIRFNTWTGLKYLECFPSRPG
jgi:hypothetical protein